MPRLMAALDSDDVSDFETPFGVPAIPEDAPVAGDASPVSASALFVPLSPDLRNDAADRAPVSTSEGAVGRDGAGSVSSVGSRSKAGLLPVRSKTYHCYLVASLKKGSSAHYIGFAVHPQRRLRQHNGEVGGLDQTGTA